MLRYTFPTFLLGYQFVLFQAARKDLQLAKVAWLQGTGDCLATLKTSQRKMCYVCPIEWYRGMHQQLFDKC